MYGFTHFRCKCSVFTFSIQNGIHTSKMAFYTEECEGTGIDISYFILHFIILFSISFNLKLIDAAKR